MWVTENKTKDPEQNNINKMYRGKQTDKQTKWSHAQLSTPWNALIYQCTVATHWVTPRALTWGMRQQQQQQRQRQQPNNPGMIRKVEAWWFNTEDNSCFKHSAEWSQRHLVMHFIVHSRNGLFLYPSTEQAAFLITPQDFPKHTHSPGTLKPV